MNKKLKSKDVQRLQMDLIKYCNQIGIQEPPKLIIDRKEFHALEVTNGLQKHAGGYGSCCVKLKTIFVDSGRRFDQRSTYHKLIKGTKIYDDYKTLIWKYGTGRVLYKTLDQNSKGEYTQVRYHHDGKHYRIDKRVKATYRDKLNTLVHELVHYRFRSLRHGKQFEARIDEVLRGKTFPIMQEKEGN